MRESNSQSTDAGDSPPSWVTGVLPDRYDLQILQLLRKIIRAIDIHSHKVRALHNITTPQLVCLLTIVQNGSLTSKDISERIYLSPSTVVGILDRLERKGLVFRQRDSDDRRLVYTTATKKGIETARQAPSPLQDGLATALNDLSELEQATIVHSLERIVDLMEVRHVDGAPILETGRLDRDDSLESSTS